MEFKKGDKVWIESQGDLKPGVIEVEDKSRPKVKVTYTDVLSRKSKTLTMGFPITMISPREDE